MLRCLNIALFAFIVVALAACVPMANPPINAAAKGAAEQLSGPVASAALIDAANTNRGKALASPRPDAVRIDLSVTGLRPGVYAMHLHSIGKCDAPDFKTAGAHVNPSNKMHGRDNPMGAHIGDLPNLNVTENMEANISFDVPNIYIDGDNGLFDADGTSIIIHAQPDDYKTDPSGNSGARVICGTFQHLVI